MTHHCRTCGAAIAADEMKDSLSSEIHRWYLKKDTCLILVLRKDREGYFFASTETTEELFEHGPPDVVGRLIVEDLRREYAKGLESQEPPV